MYLSIALLCMAFMPISCTENVSHWFIVLYFYCNYRDLNKNKLLISKIDSRIHEPRGVVSNFQHRFRFRWILHRFYNTYKLTSSIIIINNNYNIVNNAKLIGIINFFLVPNYEIVKIQLSNRLHKRELSSGSHLRMRAFGENINLWLHPRDSILVGDNTPVYYGQYSPHQPEGVQYIRKDGVSIFNVRTAKTL